MPEINLIQYFKDNEKVLQKYCNRWGLEAPFVKMQAAVKAQNPQRLAAEANKAWMDLPETKAIRSGGFFTLCEIAEYIFEGPKY